MSVHSSQYVEFPKGYYQDLIFDCDFGKENNLGQCKNFGIFEKTTPKFDQVVGEVAAVHGK